MIRNFYGKYSCFYIINMDTCRVNRKGITVIVSMLVIFAIANETTGIISLPQSTRFYM